MRKNICVIAKLDENATVTPLKILWEDGRTFEIDRVLEIRKCASTKGGGMGMRYKCRINGQERFLWLDGYYFFVEV